MGRGRAMRCAVGKPDLPLETGSRRGALPPGKDRLAVGEARAARSPMAAERPGVDAGAVTSPPLLRNYSGRTRAAPSARRRRGAAPRWRARRAGARRPGATPNFSYRFARCCLTAAWVMTSSSAIARVDAGSVNMSRASSGRQSATSTSRSRAVSAGGACSTSVAGARGGQRVAEHEPRLADPDLVAVSQSPRGPDTLAVDPRAVGGTEVGHAPASRKPLEHRVQAAGRRVVVDGDVVLGGLADRRAIRRRARGASCERRRSPRSAVTRRQVYVRAIQRGADRVLTLFRERYEVLATRRLRRRGADRQGARPPARPLRGAEDPPGARRGRARGPARRGARAAVAAAASGAAARARGLLRPRRLRRRDGLGRRHRPRDAAAPSAGARGSRRRACWPISPRRPRR